MANKPLKSIQFPGLSDTYTIPQVDATLATSGAAADAKKVGDEISDLKQDLNNQAVSFVEAGAISGIIKNVKVYGSGTLKYGITNINRNYTNFTGLAIYIVTNGTFGSPLTVSLSELTGHLVKPYGKELIEFDYDLSIMADQSRITVQDNTAIIKDSSYIQPESFVASGEISRALNNVIVYAKDTDTLYLGKIARSGSGGTVSLYSRKNSYTEIESITLSSLNGSAKIIYETRGIELGFDYDISWLTDGQTIGNYVDPHGEIKASRFITEIPEQLDLSDYASVGMFESMGVLGDSYASGWVYRTDDTDHPYRCWEQSWIQVLSRDVGNTAENYSFGGLTTRTWITHANGKAKLEADTAKQIYFLCLGINDVNALGMDYLGSGADYNNDADTFYGNYSHIIRIIQTHAPNARLIMFTTPFTSNGTYVAFNNAIITIANHFAIPCIQQHLDPYIKSNAFQNGLQSGHPNAVMYSEMATAYKKMIAQAMIDNPNYFKNFTGSGSNT